MYTILCKNLYLDIYFCPKGKYLKSGARTEYTVWGGHSPESWRSRYWMGVWGLCPLQLGPAGQGAKPSEAESNFKIKWAILRSRLDYLTFFELSDISSITDYLLYNYAAIWAVKGIYWIPFGGWIIHVWGLTVAFGGLSPSYAAFPCHWLKHQSTVTSLST